MPTAGAAFRNPFFGSQPSPTGEAYVGPFRAPQFDGPLAGRPTMKLSPEDLAALAKAPQRGLGTDVTVRSYNIPRAKGWMAAPDALSKLTGQPISELIDAIAPSHMYVEYDDGDQDLIARGGPALSRDGLTVTAEVTPARVSKDYGEGDQLLYHRFLPGVDATQAARPARWVADRAARGGNVYSPFINSNSYAADALEETTGDRVGTSHTWGAGGHILDFPDPLPDLTPYILAPR